MENDLCTINTSEDFVPGTQIETANQRSGQSHHAFCTYLQLIDLSFHAGSISSIKPQSRQQGLANDAPRPSL
jgi:hypothetical protein